MGLVQKNLLALLQNGAVVDLPTLRARYGLEHGALPGYQTLYVAARRLVERRLVERIGRKGYARTGTVPPGDKVLQARLDRAQEEMRKAQAEARVARRRAAEATEAYWALRAGSTPPEQPSAA